MTAKNETWTYNEGTMLVMRGNVVVAAIDPEGDGRVETHKDGRRIAAVPVLEAALMRVYKTRGCGCAAGVGRCSHCEAGDALRKAGRIS